MSSTPEPRRAPPPVLAAACVMAAVSAAHLAVLVATVTRTTLLRQEVAADHPGAPVSVIEALVERSVVLTVAVHLPLVGLVGFLAYRLPGGHPWTVRPATMSQLFSIAFAYAGTPPFPDLHRLVPLLIGAEAAVVVLIWASPRSRAFIRTHPARPRRNGGLLSEPREGVSRTPRWARRPG